MALCFAGSHDEPAAASVLSGGAHGATLALTAAILLLLLLRSLWIQHVELIYMVPVTVLHVQAFRARRQSPRNQTCGTGALLPLPVAWLCCCTGCCQLSLLGQKCLLANLLSA